MTKDKQKDGQIARNLAQELIDANARIKDLQAGHARLLETIAENVKRHREEVDQAYSDGYAACLKNTAPVSVMASDLAALLAVQTKNIALTFESMAKSDGIRWARQP